MTVTIKPAHAADEAAIRQCAQDAYAHYVLRIGRRPAPMDADYAVHIAAGEVHIAWDEDGTLAGFIVFYRQAGAMFLENIAVRPDASGRGIGRRLIALCENAARQAGLPAVELYTNEKMTENIALYPRLGYTETGRRTEVGFNRVFFRKVL